MKHITILLLLLIAGCTTSTITDPNGMSYTGKAATLMAEVEAKNTLTAQGRITEMTKYNPLLYAGFVVTAVAGVLIMILTKSSYLWIIPASSLCGLVLITFWARFSGIIALVTLGIGLVLAGWKLVEYQWERNKARDELKGETK